MIGAGGMAGRWLRRFLTPFYDRVQIVGLCDIDPQILNEQGDWLGLPPEARFTEMEPAFEKTEADCCLIAIPPRFHRQAAELAAHRGMHILSEKPIADTWEDCVAVYKAVQSNGVKMEVVQNYRYSPRIQTLKKYLEAGEIGRLNYIVARFAADYRRRGGWGSPFRHEIRHSLLIEGSVHHFDQIRHLSGADCRWIAGWDWNPNHPAFDGECCGLFVAQMTNGVFAQYEGNCLEGGEENNWHDELYRLEGDQGALSVGRDQRVRLYRHTPGEGLTVRELPNVRMERQGHIELFQQFFDWLDGGPTPPTALEDNIKSAAMLFGAIEASETNTVVDVTAKLRGALG